MELTSYIPGRIRLKVKKVYKDEESAELLKIYLNSLEGVIKSRVNCVIASVLVVYNIEQIDKKILIEKIDFFEPQNNLYLNYIKEYHQDYFCAEKNFHLAKDRIFIFGGIYLLYKFKSLLFGKSFFSSSLPIVVTASLITILKDYPTLNRAYIKLTDYFSVDSDKLLTATGVVLTLLRESDGLIILILKSLSDTIHAYSRLELKKFLVEGTKNLLSLLRYEHQGENYWIPVGEVQIGDIISFFTNDTIVLDGVITQGECVMSCRYYNGEIDERILREGELVYEGMVLISGEIKVKVKKVAKLHYKEELPLEELKISKQVTEYREKAFSNSLTIALLSYIIIGNPLNCVSIFLLMSPSASEIALNIGLVKYLKLLSSHGIMLKDLSKIESILDIDSIAFDKTGTLTTENLISGEEEVVKNGENIVEHLNRLGVKKTFILSGDSYEKVKYIADNLDIAEYYHGLSREEKKILIEVKKDLGTVVMVGDGINDIDAMDCADLSICIREKSCLQAINYADCIFLEDDLELIAKLLELTKKSYLEIEKNIKMTQTVNYLFASLSIFNGITLFTAKSLNDLNTFIAILSSARILNLESNLTIKGDDY